MVNSKFALYLLQKQSLIKPQKKSHYLEILKDHLGLHSTDNLTPYLSLWSRVEDFDPELLFNAIHQHQALLKRAYRGTVFVIHKSILSLIINTSGYFIQNWVKGFINYSVKEEFDIDFYKRKIITHFQGGNQFTVKELKKVIDIDKKGDFLSLFLRYLELEGTLVRTPQKYITENIINYGLLGDFYPDLKEEKMTSEKAISSLLKLYINQYGPISIDDFCWWLPLTKTKVKEALKMISDDLIDLTFDNRECLMTKEDFNKFEKFDETLDGPIINFLPYEDHFPKAYTNRSWFLSQENMKYLFEVGRLEFGQLRPSIWLNNEIVGRWEINYLDSKKISAEVSIKYLDKNRTKSDEIQTKINQRKKELEEFLNTKLLPLANER